MAHLANQKTLLFTTITESCKCSISAMLVLYLQPLQSPSLQAFGINLNFATPTGSLSW